MKQATRFVATPQGIRFAMTGIKGVGTGVVEAIIAGAEKEGALQKLLPIFQAGRSAQSGQKSDRKPGGGRLF